MRSLFSKKRYNDLSKGEKADVVQILSQLIETPFSISGIEANFSHGIGNEAVREITNYTVKTLFVIFSVQLILTFLGLYKGVSFLNGGFWNFALHPFCLAIWPFILFFCFKAIYLCFKKSRKFKNDSTKYAKELIENSSKFNNFIKYL